MSGKSKGQQAPTTSEPVVGSQPAYLQGASQTMQPAGMPGQIAALAQQLSAGFGSTPAAFLADLNKTYKPAKTLDFTKAGTAPKAGATTSAAPKSLDPNAMILIDGKWKRVNQTSAGYK